MEEYVLSLLGGGLSPTCRWPFVKGDRLSGYLLTPNRDNTETPMPCRGCVPRPNCLGMRNLSTPPEDGNLRRVPLWCCLVLSLSKKKFISNVKMYGKNVQENIHPL